MLIKLYNKEYGEHITKEDIDRYNWFPEKVYKKLIPKLFKMSYKFELLNELISHYLFLLNYKYKIDILTLNKAKKQDIEKCLEQLNIKKRKEYDKIVIAKKEKVKYDYDIFIDDNPNMAFDIKDYPNKFLLLYDSPWNRFVKTKHYRNVFRVHDWNEIYTHIEQLEKIL